MTRKAGSKVAGLGGIKAAEYIAPHTVCGEKSMVRSATFTAKQVASRLSVSVGSVTRWIESGKLTAFKNGDQWWIRDKDIDRFLASSGPEAPDEDDHF